MNSRVSFVCKRADTYRYSCEMQNVTITTFFSNAIFSPLLHHALAPPPLPAGPPPLLRPPPPRPASGVRGGEEEEEEGKEEGGGARQRQGPVRLQHAKVSFPPQKKKKTEKIVFFPCCIIGEPLDQEQNEYVYTYLQR